jgi:phage shock protein PspC (stress-responsive transcriptional regulator)
VSETARPRLQRGHDRWLAGVCSGLAEYFHIDPLIVRIAFVAAAFLQGWGILLYLVLWFLMPAPDEPSAPISDFRSHFRAMSEDLRHLGMNFAGGRSTSPPAAGAPSTDVTPPPPPTRSPQGTRGGIVVGVVLIALGAWFLLQNLGLLEWWRWDLFWPVVIILLGLALLARRFR